MRSLNRAAQRKLFGIGASITAGAMIVAGGAGLAATAAPTDVSEGWGKFLGGSALGVDLDTLLALESALAETPSGTASENVPLTATVLNAITVALPAVDLLGDNGILQLGAVEQLAEADANGDAFAGSGAVTDSSGAIAIDGAPGDDVANASLDLSTLAANAGLDDIIGELRLEIGALASRAEEVQGVVDSEYLIADLSLDVESLAVANVYGTLNSTVGTLQTTLDGLAASLNTALSVQLLGILGATANVALTPPDLTALLPTGPLGDGAVTVDLTNGQITVDIEQVLAENGQNLNSLDPNTELLTPEVLGWIVDDITETVTDIVQDVLDGVVAAVENTALTGTVSVNVLGNALVLNIGGTIVAPTVTVGTVGPLLDTILGLLGLFGITLDGVTAAVSTLLTGALSGVLGTLSTFETTVNGIVDSLDVDLIAPLLTGLDGLVNLTANVQPTAPPTSAATGDLPIGSGGDPSFTVRALQITLLGAVGAAPLAQVNLASSTVRGTIAVADADTDADVDADTDTDTDVDADADIDADVDVDAPDTDVDTDTDVDADVDTDADADGGVPGTGTGGTLPNTGSGLDSLWLIGFGSLLLLAGGASLLVRRRNV